MSTIAVVTTTVTTAVINRKNQPMTNTGSVYVGRPSPFGNPFRIGSDGTRAEVIAKYEAYARDRIAHDSRFRADVKGLYGRTLSCWCAPLKCHADVLAKLSEELNNRP